MGNGNGTVYADWSSSAIELTATGPLSVRIAEGFPHGNEYAVIINGSEAFQLNTNSTKNTYPGAEPDHEGLGGGTAMTFFDHTILQTGVTASVRIEKLTESRTDAGGLLAFAGVIATALLPAAHSSPTRSIECIGDSIMCDNHARRFAPFPDDCPSDRGTDLTSGFMARESSRLSWCPVLARALNADYQVKCCSGDGLIMTDGATCKSVGGPEICLPALQPHRLMCDAEVGAALPRHCPGLGGGAPLTAADGTPDAIVINLGQNDFGKPAHIDPVTGKPVPNHLPSPGQWALHYSWFLGNMTALYAPNLPTYFLACGGMAPKYCNDTKAAVQQMNDAGMANVYFLDITASSVGANASYMGCAGHPSWIGHSKAADIAEPIVKQVMGW